MWSFLWQLYSAIEDWAAWATAEVTRWPDDLRLAADADARAVGGSGQRSTPPEAGQDSNRDDRGRSDGQDRGRPPATSDRIRARLDHAKPFEPCRSSRGQERSRP